MDNMPAWAVSVIGVAVALNPGLALLMARPIGRFPRRVLIVRGHGDAAAVANRLGLGSRDQADDRSPRPGSLMRT
jgi:hypothetical protein